LNQDEAAIKRLDALLRGTESDRPVSQAERAFERLPVPLSTWLQPLTTYVQKRSESSLKLGLNTIWTTELWEPCQKGLHQRYPLFGYSDKDAHLKDFSQFFGPSGILEIFYNDHIKGQPAISESVRRHFKDAERIRDAFFPLGGSDVSIQFTLTPSVLDNKANKFHLDLEGQSIFYDHGPVQSQTFTWPGPHPGTVRFWFEMRDGHSISRQSKGDWAWLRVLDQAEIKAGGDLESFIVTFQADGVSATYKLRASSVHHPFMLTTLKQFRCLKGL
jgi:type VI secretion system protein ImpL